MNTTLNDTTFEAGREHYRDMLRDAQANIELRRGEPRNGQRKPFLAAASDRFAHLMELVRRTRIAALAAPRAGADPCPDGTACE